MWECVRFVNEMLWTDATKRGVLCEVTYAFNGSGACDGLYASAVEVFVQVFSIQCILNLDQQ